MVLPTDEGVLRRGQKVRGRRGVSPESQESTPAALLPAPRHRIAMLAPSLAPRAGVTCTTSARGPRERHSAWRRSGGSDRRARGKQRCDEKARAGRSRRASSSAEAPNDEWGANHEEWRVYVRSLTGLTRRAALMATVGGLSLGPARADEAESSVEDASSTSDDGAASSFGRESPSVGAPSADVPPTAAPADDPWEGSYVKPAMTVPQYIEEVRGHRSPVDVPSRLAIALQKQIVFVTRSGYFSRHQRFVKSRLESHTRPLVSKPAR